jgi:NAD(P)-dependent dehydrogenase (short-subunit alcohol dehydrogenase family)
LDNGARVTTQIDLTGQVAVVTGGGGGIGAASAHALATAGAHVVVAEIDEQRAKDNVELIRADGYSADAVVDDVTKQEDVDRLAHTAGHADILVNNVGHFLQPRAFVDSDAAHWDALHAVNLLHVFACSRAFLPTMVERGAGSIINVTSVEGMRGYPADPVYGSYKAAVAHFTRCLAADHSFLRTPAYGMPEGYQCEHRAIAAGRAQARPSKTSTGWWRCWTMPNGDLLIAIG